MNLEDDAPETPPVEPVAPPPPAETHEAAVEMEGQKYVPLSAVLAERKQRQELKAKADLADDLVQQVQALKPYAEFLKANPQLMQPRAAEPPAAPPQADPDAVEAAQLMDFYKPDGTLDVDKGAKYLALQDRRASRASSEAVKPLRDHSLQERSQQNFVRALSVKDASGQSPSPDALRAVWGVLKPEDTANPEIAATLAMLAMGADRMMGRGTPPPSLGPSVAPSPPPLVTETSGGTIQTPGSLSRLEETIAAQRGMTTAAWRDATTGIVPGRSNVLEE